MKIRVTLLALSLLTTQPVQAQRYLGVTVLEKASLENASFLGPTTLERITAKALSIIGPATFDHVTAITLSITGPVTFSDLKITGDTTIIGPVSDSHKGVFRRLTVTGPFMANDITCARLKVTGEVTVTNLNVSGDAIVTGTLAATNSSFKRLTVTAEAITLNNVQMRSIVVKKSNGSDKPQVLRLQGKTVIKGDITFESGIGHIEQDKEVRVDGKIVGAL